MERLAPSQQLHFQKIVEQKDLPNNQSSEKPSMNAQMELQIHDELLNTEQKQSEEKKMQRLAFSQKHKQSLRTFDFHSIIPLTDRMMKFRSKAFLWVYEQAKHLLQLEDRTVQHAFKVFDKFVAINNINYEAFWEVEMDIITCLFLSSKYCQIYPPTLADIICITSNPFEKFAIIKREIQIFKGVGLNLNISLVSDWYGLMTGNKSIPRWGYMCLIEIEVDMTAQFIAERVYQIQQQLNAMKITNDNDMFMHAMLRMGQQRKHMLKKSKLVPRKNKNKKKK